MCPPVGSRLLLLIALLALTGCMRPPRPMTESSCKAKGGYMVSFTIAAKPVCAMPTADAGKACTDGSQCIGECVPDPARYNVYGKNKALPLVPHGDQPAQGVCTAFDEGGPFPNCISYLRKGKVKTAACYD